MKKTRVKPKLIFKAFVRISKKSNFIFCPGRGTSMLWRLRGSIKLDLVGSENPLHELEAILQNSVSLVVFTSSSLYTYSNHGCPDLCSKISLLPSNRIFCRIRCWHQCLWRKMLGELPFYCKNWEIVGNIHLVDHWISIGICFTSFKQFSHEDRRRMMVVIMDTSRSKMPENENKTLTLSFIYSLRFVFSQPVISFNWYRYSFR